MFSHSRHPDAPSVVFCAAEAVPWFKVGGLADVLGSLPKSLAALGASVRVVVPRYGSLEPEAAGLTPLHDAQGHPLRLTLPFLGEATTLSVWTVPLPGSAVPVYFLEHPRFAEPPEVYPAHGLGERLLLLNKALFPLCEATGGPPAILHLHDWHTAYAIPELADVRHAHPAWTGTRSVLTLHNLAYQGGLGGHNWLAEGIRLADAVTTVSPTYAQEVLTPPYGAGLDGLLRERVERATAAGHPARGLTGILNGIDPAVYDPATDPHLVETYTAVSAPVGKAVNKRHVQEALGLPVDPELPLVAMVSRLVDQKGLDLILPVLDALAGLPAQWVFLGSGEPAYEAALKAAAERHPSVACAIGFHATLAQRLYAASDAFLMPSRFEPCGLGQLIAMRYGSLPLVRLTGGLADTVLDLNAQPDVGNGFGFVPETPEALLETVQRMLMAWRDRDGWRQAVRRAMAEDFSWRESARRYLGLYRFLWAASPVSGTI